MLRHIATVTVALTFAGALTVGAIATSTPGEDRPTEASAPAQSMTSLAMVGTTARMKW